MGLIRLKFVEMFSFFGCCSVFFWRFQNVQFENFAANREFTAFFNYTFIESSRYMAVELILKTLGFHCWTLRIPTVQFFRFGSLWPKEMFVDLPSEGPDISRLIRLVVHKKPPPQWKWRWWWSRLQQWFRKNRLSCKRWRAVKHLNNLPAVKELRTKVDSGVPGPKDISDCVLNTQLEANEGSTSVPMPHVPTCSSNIIEMFNWWYRQVFYGYSKKYSTYNVIIQKCILLRVRIKHQGQGPAFHTNEKHWTSLLASHLPSPVTTHIHVWKFME